MSTVKSDIQALFASFLEKHSRQRARELHQDGVSYDVIIIALRHELEEVNTWWNRLGGRQSLCGQMFRDAAIDRLAESEAEYISKCSELGRSEAEARQEMNDRRGARLDLIDRSARSFIRALS